MQVVSHWDADGIGSVSIFFRAKGNFKIPTYFTSPTLLRSTLCKLGMKKELDELFIFDLSGSRETVLISSLWKKTLWIDHHEWSVEEKPENVEIVLKKSPSATQLVAEYFGIEDRRFLDIINQIDTNSVKYEEASMLRDYIGFVKWKYFNERNFQNILRSIAKELSLKDVSEFVLEKEKEIDEYRKWISVEVEKLVEKVRIEDVNGYKIAVLESTKFLPVYKITEKLEKEFEERFDVIAVIGWSVEGNDIKTKIEFRTQKDREVRKIAEFLGGGGHKVAAGATTKDFINSQRFIEIVKNFLEQNKI